MKLSWKEQGYMYRGPPGDAGGGEENTKSPDAGEENHDGETAKLVASEGGGRVGDGAENDSSGVSGRDGIGRGTTRKGTISPVVIGTPSPPPSSLSPPIVTSGWAHATHGGPPPPLPSPLQPPPPCVG